MKIAKLPSTRRKNLITILILALGLPLLIFASYQIVNLISNAGAEVAPKNVLVSNLTTSSVTISWATENEATGSVIPVLNGNEQSPETDKRGYGDKFTHYVELTDLEPNTSYEFLIVSDSSKYSDEDGKEFVFKTAPVTADAPTPNPIHGSVEGISGDDVIIYALYKNKSTYPVSTIVPSGGNWIMDLSTFRKVSDKSLVITDDSANLVIIAISGTAKGAVVEGSYSDLFDSNGKLKDTNTLSVASKESLYSYFPPQAQLDTYAVADDTDDTTVTPTYTPPVTPTVTDDDDDDTSTDDTFSREFKLTHDISWIDMVKGSTTSVTGTTGEDSVLVTNLTDTGATILWVSEVKESGSVEYGTSTDELGDTSVDERDGLTNQGSYYVHSVSLSRLEPETKVYFKVTSGDDEYDNGGEYFSFTTFATLSSPPPYDTISGAVDGIEDENEVVVVGYIQDGDETGSEGNSVKMSTLTDEAGKWILSIADSRTEDGAEYYEYTDGDTFYFDILTISDVDTQTESLDGISDRDVDLVVESSATSADYTKVDILDSYGVLGTGSISTSSDTSSDSSDSSTITGSSTPKTGLFDSTAFLVLLGIVPFIILGSLLMKGKKDDKKSKNNMKSMIN